MKDSTKETHPKKEGTLVPVRKLWDIKGTLRDICAQIEEFNPS